MGIEKSLIKISTSLIPALLLVLLSVWFFYGKMQLFPYHFHAWTQSDRLALAYGYTENNMALLLPATANLRPTYPPEVPLNHLNGITKADLPLPEFIVAGAMLLFNTQSPVVFRFVILLFGLAGLLFFEASIRQYGSNRYMSVFVMLSLMCAPVLTFYLNGFIPAIPALSLSLAALFCYGLFLLHNQSKYYTLSLLLFALAVMIRPTFLMPMIAMVIVQGWTDIQSFKKNGRHFIPVFAAILLLAVFYTYTTWIDRTFGSLFISALMPAESFDEFVKLMSESWQNWKFAYLSPAHYYLLLFAVFGLLLQKKGSQNELKKKLLRIALLSLLAALAYIVAMARQFPNHDYYFIESFLLPLGLITSIGLSQFEPKNRIKKIAFSAVAAIMVVYMASHSKQIMAERYTIHSWNAPAKSYQIFEGSDNWLDAQHIDRNARILVLDAQTTNIPLLLMQRKGYTVLDTKQENILESLNWEFNYIGIPNSSLFVDIFRNEPSLRQRLIPVANNGRIGLFRLGESKLQTNSLPLLMADTAHVIYQSESALVDQQLAFLPVLDTLLESGQNQLNLLFTALAENENVPVEGFHLVTDITDDNGYRHYDVQPLAVFFGAHEAMARIEALSILPTNMPPNVRLKYYIWNPGKNKIVFKNQTVYLTKYFNT